MKHNRLAPIVLFVYNRLDHTVETIDALKKNPESKDSLLYIFADNYKDDATPEQILKVKEVRKYIHTISGFKDVIIEESPQNKGLANSTIYGIGKIIKQYGRVIVLEDDDAPSPYFLAYENECLEKFKDDERYWLVSGYTDNNIITPLTDTDVFSVYRNSSWGFGTWERTWNKIIWDIDTLKGIFRHRDIYPSFAHQGGFDLPLVMFNLFNHKNDSWSIRLEFSRYLNNGLTILPNYSLIKNVGRDGSGTHSKPADMSVTFMSHKPIIPDIIPFNSKGDKQLKTSFTPHNISGFLYNIGLYFVLRRLIKPFKIATL